MRKSLKTKINEPNWFNKKLLEYFKDEKVLCLLNSNGYEEDKYSKYNFVLATRPESSISISSESENYNLTFEKLKGFYNKTKDWIFGHLAYDLKNSIEELSSENIDEINAPELLFFQPSLLFFISNNELEISFLEKRYTIADIKLLLQEIEKTKVKEKKQIADLNIIPRTKEKAYLNTIDKIKKHIQLGDIYEMNFCQEFYAKHLQIDTLNTYWDLVDISPTPFSCYYRINDIHLISASPERFIQKTGNRIISQPIKGTIKRGENMKEDDGLKDILRNSDKDKSENVMIVDLVRNDLSKTAVKGSVNVEELFGIYSFKQVFQMISTIKSKIKSNIHLVDAIKNAFPMGSMTGAPKIRSMELIEQYETTKRGIYSGSVGYITPDGDFDFNVIIRSILYNEKNSYLSFMVGGAITIESIPEKEYEECMVKAKAIKEVLGYNDK